MSKNVVTIFIFSLPLQDHRTRCSMITFRNVLKFDVAIDRLNRRVRYKPIHRDSTTGKVSHRCCSDSVSRKENVLEENVIFRGLVWYRFVWFTERSRKYLKIVFLLEATPG